VRIGRVWPVAGSSPCGGRDAHDSMFSASVRYRVARLTPNVSAIRCLIIRRRCVRVSSTTGIYNCLAMFAKRDRCSWCATVMVLVGPLRCLARIRSASPARGLSRS
jgi:hypothetical protein